MPIYEYQCERCGERTEALQKVSDPPLTSCPSCGGPLRKLLSAPAVQFKGSGWYVTDYAGKGRSGRKDEGAGDKAEKTEKTDAGEKKDAKAEGRPSGAGSGSGSPGEGA